jgi:hypothetical protein
MSAEVPDVNKIECMKISLTDRMSTIHGLDDAILLLVEEESIVKEIEEAGEFKERIQMYLVNINSLLKKLQLTTPNQAPVNTDHSAGNTGDSSFTEVTQVRTKLPKLQLNKFNGDPKVWNEWWDSYKCAIHDNTHMFEVEKFNYLRSYLQGKAASAVAGLQLTSANYTIALDLLKGRFAQKQTIINAHMDALLKLEGTTCNSDVNKIRRVYDSIEVHVRGLKTLGVESEQYGTLLVPIILSKVPEDLRLILSRQISTENWKLDEILKHLRTELEARERCASSTIKENIKENSKQSSKDGSSPKGDGGRLKGSYLSAAALQAQGIKVSCTYCRKAHTSFKCDVITNVQARKELLKKEGRCYVCLRKSHLAKDCNGKSCFKCNKRHHPSICEQAPQTPPPQREQNKGGDKPPGAVLKK